MLVITAYENGAGYKVRLHHHARSENPGCDENCQEYSVQRAYPQRGATGAETRRLVMAAIQNAVNSPAIGHVEFLRLLSDDDPLF